MMRLSRLRAALVGRPGVMPLTGGSAGALGGGCCEEWDMTGKGTVEASDADMNDWPDGWDRGGAPGGPAYPAARPKGADEPTQVLRRPAEPSRGGGGSDRFGGSGRGTTTPPPAVPRRRTTGRWLRRVAIAVLLIVALFIGLVFFFYARVGKVDALQDYAGRPAAMPGQDWLLIGSDSREGLTRKQVKQLHVGHAAGRRTDTIILLHKPSSGPSTLVSLPRDSYVPIPGHGHNKLNAAYAFGGAALLVQTVERVTGIRIDHYAEIGFGGFVGMTDAVGGVKLCPARNIRDKLADLHVKKGCQHADGRVALAYARSRHADPKLGDVARGGQQRQVVNAVGKKALSPWTFLNPFRYWSLNMSAADSLKVDQDLSVFGMGRFAYGLTHAQLNCVVPISDLAVHLDPVRSKQMFRLIREDDTSSIGKGLCTQSGLPKS
jgi:LCP family protein required for cell wall assembly